MLFKVIGVPDDATIVPVVVTALALSVHAPFLKATAPFAALNAAVLKLSVIGAVDSSADNGATSPLATVCVATTVSAPPQFMIRFTFESFCVPGSTLGVTSSWPAMLLSVAGTEPAAVV